MPEAGEDDGVLEVEVAGRLRGATSFTTTAPNAPIIMGSRDRGAHLGHWPQPRRRRGGVGSGDRRCGGGDVRMRQVRAVPHGQVPYVQRVQGLRGARVKSDLAPHLWGRLTANFVYLPPTARVATHLRGASGRTLPCLSARCWATGSAGCAPSAGVTIGDTAVVVGPGPQGLAATVAARESGAREIVVVGLSRDEARLSMARRLGATRAIAAGPGRPTGRGRRS